MVAFQRPDRLTKTEDLNYVKIEGKKATLVDHWSLPVNPEKILDVTLVTCLLGDGVMVLYQGFSGEKFLVFKVLAADDEDSVGFEVQVPCPEGKRVSFLVLKSTLPAWQPLYDGLTP